MQVTTIRECLEKASIAAISGGERALTKVNYFKGINPDNWIQNIPTFNELHFGEVYNGIELKLKASGNNIEKVFLIRPGGNPSDIKFRVAGVSTLRVNEKGELEINLADRFLRFSRPVAYQESNGIRKPVKVAYHVDKCEYSFTVGPYDKSMTLVIDPIITATFLGGNDNDFITAIAINSSGEVYATGWTNSLDFPNIASASPDNLFNGGSESFIVKLTPDLDSVSAATFLGGNMSDSAYDIAVGNTGNVYVAGLTESKDFPGISDVSSLDSVFTGNEEGFIINLDSDLSSILSATFLGGDNYDAVQSLTFDNLGNIFVAGSTGSSDFPGISDDSADNTLNDAGDFKGSYDGFTAKLTPDLSSLIASTFIGGSKDDIAFAIAYDDNTQDVGRFTSLDIDSGDNVHIGYYNLTNSDLKYISDVTGSFMPSTKDRTGDVGRYASLIIDSSDKVHISYYDASNGDLKYATNASGSWVVTTLVSEGTIGVYTSIDIDSNDAVHISYYDAINNDLKYATNASGDWVITPVDGTDVNVGEYTSLAIDSNDAVHISYYDATNGDLKYITNASGDWTFSTLDDVVEKIFVTGRTHSADFPVSENSADSSFTQYHDEGFVVKLNSELSLFLATSYPGGSDDDYSYAIIPEGNGNVFLAGLTYSSDFPLPPSPYIPADSTFEGYNEGFIAKLDVDLNVLLASTFLGGSNNDYPYALVRDTTGDIYISGYTQSPDFPGIDASSADADFGPYYEGFIAYMNANLDTSLLGATFLGGNDYDNSHDITLDALGNVYVAGWTYSEDFPGIFSGSADMQFGGSNEGYLIKLTPGLTLLSTGPTTTVRLTLSQGNGTITSGSIFPITWQSNNLSQKIAKSKLYYQKNNSKWKHIKTLQGSPGYYEWIVPDILKENDTILFKIVLRDKKGKLLGMDVSDKYSVTKTSP